MQNLTKNITDVLNIVNIINDKLSSIDSKKVDKAIMSSFRDSINILLEATKIINDASKLDYFKQLTDEINKINQQKILYETYKQTLTNISKKLVDNIPLTEKENELLTNVPYTPTNIYECLNIVTSSILNIFKSISDLNKIEAVNPIKLLWNLELSVVNLNNIIKKIPKIFESINTDTLREIAKGLSTSNINKTTSYKQDDKVIKENEVIDKMSPMDLIKTILELIGDMSNIKVINPIKLTASIIGLEKTLNSIIKNIENIYSILGDFNKNNKSIIKQGKKASESISSMINDIVSIVDNIIKLAKNTISVIIVMPVVMLLIKTIILFINTILESFKLIGSSKKIKDYSKNINNIEEIITGILEISLYIIGLSLLLLPLIPAITISIICVLGVTLFINTILKSFKFIGSSKKIKDYSKNINNIKEIITGILEISLYIIGLSLLLLPLIPAITISVICVLGIIAFITLAKIIFNITESINIKSINRIAKNINKLIKHIIIIGLNTIALAILSPIILPAVLISTITTLAIVGFVFVLKLLLNVSKIKSKDILTLIILGLFIGLLIAISYMILKLSEIGSEINWLGLLSSVGAILLVSIIAIAIGFAASTIFPILGVSILGMLGVIVLVSLLTLTAVLLKELQKFVLDQESLNQNITIIFDTVRNIISNLFKPDDTKEEKSNKTWFGSLMEQVGGRFSALKSISEAILTIPFLLSALISIGCLYLIANMLSKISEIQISKDINTKISEIIGTAKSISDLILTPVKSISGEGGKETKFDKFKNWFGNTGLGKMVNGAVEIASNIGATGALASILPSIMMLSSVVDLIKSINELTIPKDINTKVTSIIDTAKIISNQVLDNGNIQSIDEDKVEAFGEYVEDSVKYFEGINKLKVENVKSLADMYVKMGQFMDKLQDAPISEIADALVNKISPALSDINNNLDKRSNSIQQTAPHVAQQTPQTTQQIQQVDYTSILENIEDLLEKIKQKINENAQLSFS